MLRQVIGVLVILRFSWCPSIGHGTSGAWVDGATSGRRSFAVRSTERAFAHARICSTSLSSLSSSKGWPDPPRASAAAWGPATSALTRTGGGIEADGHSYDDRTIGQSEIECKTLLLA